MSENLSKAIAPFSVVLISTLFMGNVYFANRTVDRIEKKIDAFEDRLNRHELDIARLEVKTEEVKTYKEKTCSRISSKG